MFATIPQILTIEKPDDTHEYVQILGLLHNKREYRWIDKRYIQGPANFGLYKVFLPKSNGSGALGEVLSTPLIGRPLIGRPLIGHTQTFISVGAFNNRAQAEACMKYVKTKFARAILGVLKVTQHNHTHTWGYVPLQDFSSSSDIDWSQSVTGIDRQLYAKYGLDRDEIDFVESRVKEMD